MIYPKKDIKNIILYLVKRLEKEAEGKKKVMKLMFLMEHYDFDKGGLVKNKFLGNSFSIYYYGVFSREVADFTDSLIREESLEDGFPLEAKIDISKLKLDEEIKNKADKVIKKFGKDSGYKLEVSTLKMLSIDPSDKMKFFGKEVQELIKKT